jgi:hypothetical protein
MTAEGRQIDLGRYRLREIQGNLLLVSIAGVAVGLWVAGPTWSSLGLALAYTAVGFLVTVLPAIAAGALGHKPPRAALALFPAAASELLRLGLITWAGLGPVEAAWLGLWIAFLGTTTGLVIFKFAHMVNTVAPDGIDMTREHPGSLLAPQRLLLVVASICREVACCLLVVWNPWLMLLTFAQGASGGLPKDGSAAQKWVKTVGGYALLALALFLWLG